MRFSWPANFYDSSFKTCTIKYKNRFITYRTTAKVVKSKFFASPYFDRFSNMETHNSCLLSLLATTIEKLTLEEYFNVVNDRITIKFETNKTQYVRTLYFCPCAIFATIWEIFPLKSFRTLPPRKCTTSASSLTAFRFVANPVKHTATPNIDPL